MPHANFPSTKRQGGKSTLERSLGLPMLCFYGTGMILGAGIYSIIGKAAGPAQDSLWIAFIMAAVSVFLTALSYAELSTMFSRAGAEYVFLSQAFKKQKWVGSTVGVAVAFSGAATSATVALAFAGYLGQFMEVPTRAAAAVLLIFFGGVSLLGIRVSGWTNVFFTLIEIAGLFTIIYLGLKSDKFGEALSTLPHKGTLQAAALVVFSFFGFESIANLAEEAKNPERDIPRAIFISLIFSTLIYIGVSLAALALLSTSELYQSHAALMSVAQKVSSKTATVLGGVALFSTANTALIAIVGSSRMLYGMAKHKSLPQALSRLVPSKKTPWVATLVILACALSLLILRRVEVVASITSLSTMVAFIAVNIALIKLRKTEPRLHRPFRVPFSIAKIPVLPLLGALSSLAFLSQFEKLSYLVGGSFLLGLGVLFWWRERKLF